MSKVTKDTFIGDLLKMGDQNEIAAILMSAGMHCIGCAIANHETIEQAAEVHGIDANQLIDKLNSIIA